MCWPLTRPNLPGLCKAWTLGPTPGHRWFPLVTECPALLSTSRALVWLLRGRGRTQGLRAGSSQDCGSQDGSPMGRSPRPPSTGTGVSGVGRDCMTPALWTHSPAQKQSHRLPEWGWGLLPAPLDFSLYLLFLLTQRPPHRQAPPCCLCLALTSVSASEPQSLSSLSTSLGVSPYSEPPGPHPATVSPSSSRIDRPDSSLPPAGLRAGWLREAQAGHTDSRASHLPAGRRLRANALDRGAPGASLSRRAARDN